MTLGLLAMATLHATAQTENQQERTGQKPRAAAQMIEKMDTNKDGKLSKTEIKGPLKDDFDTLDKDRDGFLSEEELKDAPKPKGKPRTERAPKN